MQHLRERRFKLHIAAVQIPCIDHAHVLEDVATVRRLHKDGNPGGCVIYLVQLDTVYRIATNIGACGLNGVPHVAANTQARQRIEVALVFVRIKEKDARAGIIVCR